MYAVVFQLGYVPIGLAATTAMTFLGRFISGLAPPHPGRGVLEPGASHWLAIDDRSALASRKLHEWIFRLLADAQYHRYRLFCLDGSGGRICRRPDACPEVDVGYDPAIAAKIVTAIWAWSWIWLGLRSLLAGSWPRQPSQPYFL
jgi:hypothetical protein